MPRTHVSNLAATACRKGSGLVLHGRLVQINGFRTGYGGKLHEGRVRRRMRTG
ncbi:hypothetical protein EKH55_0952 [Sinorhizobium alkalisoli]|nr:hypothetical protein EKH55_0952 [Sinorhizobium alkalisoli]